MINLRLLSVLRSYHLKVCRWRVSERKFGMTKMIISGGSLVLKLIYMKSGFYLENSPRAVTLQARWWFNVRRELCKPLNRLTLYASIMQCLVQNNSSDVISVPLSQNVALIMVDLLQFNNEGSSSLINFMRVQKCVFGCLIWRQIKELRLLHNWMGWNDIIVFKHSIFFITFPIVKSHE